MLMVGARTSIAVAHRTREFILAARVAGKSGSRISVEHILPNLANLLIVQGIIQFSPGILAAAQSMAALVPHVTIIPGRAIGLMVLGLNLPGDGLCDLLDPRLRVQRT